MGHLTTHVLDTARGQPGSGIKVTLYRHVGESVEFVREAVTNADGRCAEPLLDGAAFTPGRYRLTFAMGIYFARAGFAVADPPFVDDVILDFGIADTQEHYHVPLLVSPWSWATYRGS